MNWNALFNYDGDTGLLSWKISGNRITCVNSEGYVSAKVAQRQYKAHRIIWDMHNPDDVLSCGEQIDHINHNRSDNRLCNLRKVTVSENHRNTSRAGNNKSGVTGVYWFKRTGKWKVQIKVSGVQIHIGYFDNLDEAKAARLAAERLYGLHDNHGTK